ncbi:MAG: hypothetical protein LBM92_09045 [Opitutaceae bacterium]|nr:hypothetical protein [Opitutaceae bacterium]
MSTTTISRKTLAKKKALRAKKKQAALRPLKIDLTKPIQGQGAGTFILAPDYDPNEPAIPLSDWEYLREQ